MLISVSLWEHFLNFCTGKIEVLLHFHAIPCYCRSRSLRCLILRTHRSFQDVFFKRTCRRFKSFLSILCHWTPLPAVPAAHPHLNSLCVVRGFKGSSLLMHNSTKNGLKNIIMQRAMRVHNRSELTEQEEKEWNFSFWTALCCSNPNMHTAACEQE